MALNYAEAIYALDDSDLDVYQVRVWLRILRRGICYESQRSMADSMNISLGKVNQAIQWLLENGWVVREADHKTKKMGYAAVLPHEQTQQLNVHDIEHVSPHERDVLPHEHSVLLHERHLKAKEIKAKEIKTTAAAREAEKQNDSAIVFYENNIGGITPRIADWVLEAVGEFGEQVVIEAMDEAVLNNVRRWKYIAAILDNWKKNGRIKPGKNGHKVEKTFALVDEHGNEIDKVVLNV
jgi:DnaD/phage-associated family protein